MEVDLQDTYLQATSRLPEYMKIWCVYSFCFLSRLRQSSSIFLHLLVNIHNSPIALHMQRACFANVVQRFVSTNEIVRRVTLYVDNLLRFELVVNIEDTCSMFHLNLAQVN
jgi:hypothetical protein